MKKLFIGLLALAMMFSFIGCADSTSSGSYNMSLKAQDDGILITFTRPANGIII